MDRISSYIVFFVCGQILLWLTMSCSFVQNKQRIEADKLTHLSYTNKYKDLDKCLAYADSAYKISCQIHYNEGQSKALNLKAFYMMSKMRYADADSILKMASHISSNGISRLCTEISYMRLCQRRSLNKEFYFHRFYAERIINKISKNPRLLSREDRMLYTFCKSEYGIILSTYFYYVGREKDSEQALADILTDKDIHIESDTAQWLAYLYNTNEIELCKYIAKRSGHIFWEANAKQLECEQLMTASGDSILCQQLATEALNDFMEYGNTYQIAAAWRTMADAYGRQRDYDNMLNSLLIALNDTLVYQSPTIVASIDDRLCIAYSAFNNKLLADIARNEYLDIQDTTRQDRQLEARADALDMKMNRLQTLGGIIVILVIAMAVAALIMVRNRKKSGFNKRLARETAHLEELEDECNMLKLQITDALRVSIEQHSKISIIQNMQSLIDRMSIAGQKVGVDDSAKDYLNELCATVEEGNNMLTRWIQLRKGNIKLHIETFPVQQLFDIILKNNAAFASKGIKLICEPTDIRIRADRVLTFFLINTIVDNARKFTPKDGTITLRCNDSETEGYADINVTDTGTGMTQEEANHLFEYRVIKDDNAHEDLTEQRSHGFGLVNCRGIIDRYKKTSSFFEQASIKAESGVGKGTSVTFRLPKILKMLIVTLCCSCIMPAYAQNRASQYGDSMYVCNVNGRYADCLRYADSCRHELNKYYLSLPGKSAADTLMADSGEAELKWLRDSVKVDYDLILAMRNESAVAAMALHLWYDYEVNNKAYVRLYKNFTTDTSLDEYCQDMERYEDWMRLAFVVLFMLIACILWFFYSQYIKHYVVARRNINDEIEDKENAIELLKAEYNKLYVSNSIADNCLSTIKHETMYYPSRINYLIGSNADKEQLVETIDYYKTLYQLLSSHCQTLLNAVPVKLSNLKWHDVESNCKGLLSVQCQVSPDITLIANKELLYYTFLLLKKKNKAPIAITSCSVDDNYIRLNATCDGISAADNPPASIFQLQTPDPDYLVIRQIMREIGDGALRYASGVTATATSQGGIDMCITLPISQNNNF